MPSCCRTTSSTWRCARPSIRRHTQICRAASLNCGARLREGSRRRISSGLVVPFEPGAYNQRGDGRARTFVRRCNRPAMADSALAANPYFRLGSQGTTGLDEILYAHGPRDRRNSDRTVQRSAADHPFFQQLAFMTADEMPTYQALLQKLKGRPYAARLRRRPRADHHAELRLYRAPASLSACSTRRSDGQDRRGANAVSTRHLPD